ncbi:IclR family transcriptional regulator [Leucobacter luti]|uniref:Glycerol operon regulatory protein n=1 Tax=Leucobacter luti TaxID=340320 RepID=A0A4R6RXC9_9MICO|nr:IclR family transcriptional regulator [Leucobacter luti]MCW2288236.1 DNA-binding IclR family transcriptional regulator [Leucobacter luti]QYM75806.1 IclR family transcriptional regulator [Leucobacter luti]TCK45606.1 IclR family transcriptional regulator [Leucobacter luti]TDP91484.1 IclR family transcriptional regulator [Leucobacter luti]
MTPTRESTGPTAGSQTLSRGLRALEILAEAETPMTITELADGLGVHRSNAYRILRTLEQHRFVARDPAGRIRLGPKLTVLARGVAPILHTAAMHPVSELAYELGMTAFITVLDADEVVTLVSVEPSNVSATIARNPGVRHPVDRGAPGHAIESSLTPAERIAAFGEATLSEAARTAQRDGYAVSRNEVIDGVTAIAVPLRLEGEPPAAVAVVHFNLPESIDAVVAALQQTAERIAENYR